MSSSSSSLFRSVLALLLLVTFTFGHSQMRCANYDLSTGKCLAPIRSEGVSFTEEKNDMKNGGGVCQTPMTTPISAAYNGGSQCGYAACPSPMGTIQQGSVFTVMWIARNHAVLDQGPGTIEVYVSPKERMDEGVDASTTVFGMNRVCQAPYMSCNNQNGDFVQCYANCTMPTQTEVGIHTIWWKWVWNSPGHDNIYTTCADIFVSGSSSQPSQPSVSATSYASRPSTSSAPQVIQPAATTQSVLASNPIPVKVTTSTPIVSNAAPFTSASPVASTTATKVVSTTAQAAPVLATTSSSPSIPSTSASPPQSGSSSSSSVSVPVSVDSQPSSGSCVYGRQICVGTSKYQTCTNANVGTYWAAPQSCQAGLSCHPSADGVNIYCY